VPQRHCQLPSACGHTIQTPSPIEKVSGQDTVSESSCLDLIAKSTLFSPAKFAFVFFTRRMGNKASYCLVIEANSTPSSNLAMLYIFHFDRKQFKPVKQPSIAINQRLEDLS
jgi:hypothetical protein